MHTHKWIIIITWFACDEVSESTVGLQIIITCLRPSIMKNYVSSLCNESLWGFNHGCTQCNGLFSLWWSIKAVTNIRFRTAWLFTVILAVKHLIQVPPPPPLRYNLTDVTNPNQFTYQYSPCNSITCIHYPGSVVTQAAVSLFLPCLKHY